MNAPDGRMKFRPVLVLISALVLTLGPVAMAFAQVDARADAMTYCAREDKRMPAPGKQFDGKPADPAVLALKPGIHALDNGGSVEIFENGGFLLTRPRGSTTFYGLSRDSGGELRMKRNTAAGCSRELLSEIMKRNNLKLPETAGGQAVQ